MRTFALLVLLSASSLPAAAEPRRADERVVLHTIAGDIVLALYPDAAPKHVAQILKLVRRGVYDSTHFSNVAPGFYAQVSGANDRVAPLTTEQQNAIRRLKAEFGPLHHERGTLSMSRDERDPDSAETSFSIILADWKEGDGRYTIFGRVESGMDVVDEFVKVPQESDGRPLVRLSIERAEVVRQADLAKRNLELARPVDVSQASGAKLGQAQLQAAAGGIFLMILVGAAAFAASLRHPRAVVPLCLINVLIGMFLLLMILTPMTRERPGLGLALFAALLGTLKLLGRFESPAPV